MKKMKTQSSRQEKMRPAGKSQGKNNQISHNRTAKANSTDILGQTHNTTKDVKTSLPIIIQNTITTDSRKSPPSFTPDF
jgi:hypothetical protein